MSSIIVPAGSAYDRSHLDTTPAPAGPCALVIFGVAGDLTRRLLFPALYNLARENLLPEEFAVIGFERADLSEDALRERMRAVLRDAAGKTSADSATIEWLVSRLYYIRSDFADAAGFERLVAALLETDRKHQTHGNYLFYLATAPEFFLEVVQRLSQAGLLRESNGRWRRLVIEKPFGHDRASARQLNLDLTKAAQETQIYRIDHYLGKETVRNILVFRFANGIFEPIWNRRYIDHVQITVAETIGVGTRGSYYEHTGALRDMVPNHLLQLLTFTAMEPPSTFSPSALHNEQVKVLESVPPLNKQACELYTVRAQYGAGALEGEAVPGYRQEPRVAPDSQTETYVALRLAVDNWRWAGIPFYLRTGKRLAVRRTEVAIQFRQAPLSFFRSVPIALPQANRLVLHVQPEESIELEFAAKIPGPAVIAAPVTMRFWYSDYFGRENRTGYETLLYDALIGDASPFKRGDVIEHGWAIVDPVLEAWEQRMGDLHYYPAGSDGPVAAHELMRRDGRAWRPLVDKLDRPVAAPTPDGPDREPG